jgi:uncharacterized short protein YbdD (DUF466 family)
MVTITLKKISSISTNAIHTASAYLGHAVEMARLMIGINNYEEYCKHMQIHHPEQSIMTYEEFFIYKQNARFSGKNGAKCC